VLKLQNNSGAEKLYIDNLLCHNIVIFQKYKKFLRMLKQGLGGSGYCDNEEAERAVRELLRTQETCIFNDGVFRIVRRCHEKR